MIIHLIDGRVKASPHAAVAVERERMFRVKSFASRGLITLPSERVLCVRVAIRERLRVLHRFLNGLEEAVVGA